MNVENHTLLGFIRNFFNCSVKRSRIFRSDTLLALRSVTRILGRGAAAILFCVFFRLVEGFLVTTINY